MNTLLPANRQSGNTQARLVVALIAVSIGLLVWEWRQAHARVHRPVPPTTTREVSSH